MATVDQITNVRELDAEEGRLLLDRHARRYLDMSGDEFARSGEAGEFAERDDATLVRVAMLLPFGR